MHIQALIIGVEKYDLVNVGYTTMTSFIASYQGVTNHLNKHSGDALQILNNYSI